MSEKERKSFTLDPENAELCDGHYNASALVNDLLDQYRKGSDKKTVGLDLQISQKERELEKAKGEVSRLESDLEELKQLRSGIKKQERTQLEDAREALENVPHEVGNPAIEEWASDLGMTQEELVAELR